MSLLPEWQPIRPEGNHRTHIKSPTDIYLPWTPRNIIVQIQLYRWCHGPDYQQQTIIDELWKYLFYNFHDITKRDLGMTVVQTTRYNPRILKGMTFNNPTPCSTYVFHTKEDISYGLEWMICTWIHKCSGTEDPKAVNEFLLEMASCDEEDIYDLYLEPLGQWWDWFNERSADWRWQRVWISCEYEMENQLAGPIRDRPSLSTI